jgi:hypothetical protein
LPDWLGGPYKKSASQMIGSEAAWISRLAIICGVHSVYILLLRA